MGKRVKLDVWLLVDADGDYVMGRAPGDAEDRYCDEISDRLPDIGQGSLHHLVVEVSLPGIPVVAVSIPDVPPAKVVTTVSSPVE